MSCSRSLLLSLESTENALVAGTRAPLVGVVPAALTLVVGIVVTAVSSIFLILSALTCQRTSFNHSATVMLKGVKLIVLSPARLVLGLCGVQCPCERSNERKPSASAAGDAPNGIVFQQQQFDATANSAIAPKPQVSIPKSAPATTVIDATAISTYAPTPIAGAAPLNAAVGTTASAISTLFPTPMPSAAPASLAIATIASANTFAQVAAGSGSALIPDQNWRLLSADKLGRGSFGTIYKANVEHGSTRKWYVIKVATWKDVEDRVALETESQNLVKLHALKVRHVVGYVGFIHDHVQFAKFLNKDKVSVLFLENNEGYSSLFNRDTRLNADRVCHLGVQLFEMLSDLQQHHLAHGDLSAGNLIISPSDDDLLGIDWATLKDFSTPQAVGTPFTTHWYRAPELFLGHPTFDTKIDTWSAACLLFRMATGTTLFGGAEERMVSLFIGELGLPPNDYLDKGVYTASYFNKYSAGTYSSIYLAFSTQHLQDAATIIARTSKPATGDAFAAALKSMLHWKAEQRVTAAAALQLPFFQQTPSSDGIAASKK